MRYQELPPITREAVEEAFASGNAEAIADALLRGSHHLTDWQFVQDKCIQYLQSPDSSIRYAAILSLGHLARIHGKLNTKVVVPILEQLLPDPAVGGTAGDALDDIKMFTRED